MARKRAQKEEEQRRRTTRQENNFATQDDLKAREERMTHLIQGSVGQVRKRPREESTSSHNQREDECHGQPREGSVNSHGHTELSRMASSDMTYYPTNEEAIVHRQPTNLKLTRAFSREIAHVRMPLKFNMPRLEPYRGRTDPVDHLAHFECTTSLLDLDDALKCHLFSTTFRESALRWFSHLPLGIITSFTEFRKMFTSQFAFARRRWMSSLSLFDMMQELDESLRSFIARFQREMLEVKDLNLEVAQVALIRGLLAGPFKYDIGLKKPKTLDQLLELANVHMNAEEVNNSVYKRHM